MHGQMDRNRWLNGQMDRIINGQINGWIKGQIQLIDILQIVDRLTDMNRKKLVQKNRDRHKGMKYKDTKRGRMKDRQREGERESIWMEREGKLKMEESVHKVRNMMDKGKRK